MNTTRRNLITTFLSAVPLIGGMFREREDDGGKWVMSFEDSPVFYHTDHYKCVNGVWEKK